MKSGADPFAAETRCSSHVTMAKARLTVKQTADYYFTSADENWSFDGAGPGVVPCFHETSVGRDRLATSVIKIKVKAGREAEFESIITALAAASNANEPGIRFYNGFRSVNPGEYWMVESFADDAAFAAHLASAHFLEHRSKLGDCFDGPPEMHRLTPI